MNKLSRHTDDHKNIFIILNRDFRRGLSRGGVNAELGYAYEVWRSFCCILLKNYPLNLTRKVYSALYDSRTHSAMAADCFVQSLHTNPIMQEKKIPYTNRL